MGIFSKETEKISTSDNIIENIKCFVEIHIKNYSNIVHNLFKTPYETNPQAFRFIDKKNIHIVYVKLKEDFFPRSHEQVCYYFRRDSNLDTTIVDLTDTKHYHNFHEYGSTQFTENKLQELHVADKRDLVYSEYITSYGIDIESTNSIDTQETLEKVFHSSMYNAMQSLVGEEARRFQSHSNLQANYYAKNATKFAYSLLDLEPIIQKVNNEDFSYQMDQAIAAYDQSLYMASCACLGVCLETLCKQLLIKNGVRLKDSDATMLDKLGEKLREKHIISYKFNSRINVCYKIRNLSSHTSPGITLQSDCHLLISTIHEIVETYF
jgi:hypothetical protein